MGSVIEFDFNPKKKIVVELEPQLYYGLCFASKINCVDVNYFANLYLQLAIKDLNELEDNKDDFENFFLGKDFYWEFEEKNEKEKSLENIVFNTEIDKRFKKKLKKAFNKFKSEDRVINFCFEYTVQSFLDNYNRRYNFQSLPFDSRVELIQKYLKNSSRFSEEIDFLKKRKYIAGFTDKAPVIVENKGELEKLISARYQ